MDMSNFAAEFKALAELVQAEDQVDDVGPRPEVSKPTPGSIGPRDLLPVKVAAPKGRKDPKEIWTEEELVDVVEDDFDDGRTVPNYEFVYKQSIETTDNFLGMSGKDPSSASCEELVIKIELPEAASAAEMDIDVKDTYLKLNSPHYKLSIYLPHKVDGEKGKAKWDGKKKVLAVTVPVIREDPF